MTHRRGLVVIGLVGGVASGKSRVAGELERRGALRIDADALAHEALGEPDVVAALLERFGDGIRSAGGGIDRRALGRIVFDDRGALRSLEAEVHPRVRAGIRRRLETAREGSVVVLDAALLLENGLDRICDLVVLVDTPAELRARRAARDRGWSEEEVRRREGHQTALEEKRRRADAIVRNDGTPQDLAREVARLERTIESRRPRRKR